MTKRLEEILNLAPIEEYDLNVTTESDGGNTMSDINEMRESIDAVDRAIDKIDEALPLVKDLEAGDKDMDELADLAKDTFNDLITLAMNVESRFSGPIIQSASTLLGHAVTAKVAKMDKKLKMIELQIKKARLDKIESNDGGKDQIEGTGMVVNRNELLKTMLDNSRETGKTHK